MVTRSDPLSSFERFASRRALIWFILIVLFGAAWAPTLSWMQFADPIEKLSVATSLETRREGRNWLVPTIQDEPRRHKPPITYWLGAGAIRPDTVAALSNPDESARDAAYRELAVEARWPFLVCTCFTIVAVYELGRAVGSNSVGLVGSLIAGTTFLFMRYGRLELPDVPLTLFTVATNVFLAKVIFRREWWLGCIGAGVAGALAMMSKGPVFLVESLVPAMVFVLWWRFKTTEVETSSQSIPRGAIFAGIGAFVLVGLPWFLLMLFSEHGIVELWLREISRVGALDRKPDKWYAHISFFRHLLPWTPWWIAGLILAGMHAFRRRGTPVVYVAILTILPILILSFFHERKDRYLLPMIGPASITIAFALLEHFRSSPNLVDRLFTWGHWVMLAGYGIAYPLAVAFPQKLMTGSDASDLHDVYGQPWLSPSLGWKFAIAGGVVLFLAILWHRRNRLALLFASLAIVLAWQAVYFHGLVRRETAMSYLRPLAWRLWQSDPNATVYFSQNDGDDHFMDVHRADLNIHLNRVIHWVPDPSAINPQPTNDIILIELQQLSTPAYELGNRWEFVTGEAVDRFRFKVYRLPSALH